jgi:hypothetical protein
MKNKRLNTIKLRYVFYILLTCVLCVGCNKEIKINKKDKYIEDYEKAFEYYEKAMEYVYEKTDSFEIYQDSFLIYKERCNAR